MRLIPAKRMIRKGIHVDYKEAIWAATLGVPKLKGMIHFFSFLFLFLFSFFFFFFFFFDFLKY